MRKVAQQARKQAYETPRLTVHGAVEDLTRVISDEDSCSTCV
jgi:hypothetical protein